MLSCAHARTGQRITWKCNRTAWSQHNGQRTHAHSVRSMADDNVPTLVVLRLLMRQGWREGPEPDIHTHDAVKQFGQCSFVVRKPYLRCLGMLPELTARGLQQLLSNQHMSYYKMVIGIPQASAGTHRPDGKGVRRIACRNTRTTAAPTICAGADQRRGQRCALRQQHRDAACSHCNIGRGDSASASPGEFIWGSAIPHPVASHPAIRKQFVV